MLFPIGDDQVKGGHFPLFSYTFLAANIGIFVYQLLLARSGQLDQFLMDYGSIPAETLVGKDLHTLFTSMFLHGGWSHLIGNMLFLWVFADNIEAIVGSKRFVIFYLLAGLAAHATHIFFNYGSTIPTIGASGAISGVLGAYLVLFPGSQIRLFLFPLFFWVFRLPAILFLGIWIAQQAYSGVSSMSSVVESGTAWWAHIGGFVFGVFAAFYFKSQGFGARTVVTV